MDLTLALALALTLTLTLTLPLTLPLTLALALTLTWDCKVEGTHYIQNALRYPKERDQWKSRVDRVFEALI